jgi:transcriptional regulator with GAF, ATPase, and Fis domain
MRNRGSPGDGQHNHRDSERTLILQTLEEVGWVIRGPKGAAAKLALKRTTLIHKMQKLVISRPSLQRSENMVGPALRVSDSPPQSQ